MALHEHHHPRIYLPGLAFQHRQGRRAAPSPLRAHSTRTGCRLTLSLLAGADQRELETSTSPKQPDPAPCNRRGFSPALTEPRQLTANSRSSGGAYRGTMVPSQYILPIFKVTRAIAHRSHRRPPGAPVSARVRPLGRRHRAEHGETTIVARTTKGGPTTSQTRSPLGVAGYVPRRSTVHKNGWTARSE